MRSVDQTPKLADPTLSPVDQTNAHCAEVKAIGCVWPAIVEQGKTPARQAGPERAAGIAPASQIPQVVSPHDTCAERGCQWLHYVCTDAALRELVAAWHGLAPEVREKIVGLARSSQV